MPFLLMLFAAFFQAVGISTGPQLKPPASQTSEKDKCTLSGIVTSMQTGEPVRKATLHLTLRNAGRSTNGVFEQTGYSGTSGPDGSFKFGDVEPGEYSLSGEKSGFVRTTYGSKTGQTAGTMLTLSPSQQMTEVKMQLVAQATITGRVLDEDGDPMGGISIQAVGRMWMQGGKARYFVRGNTNTDDTGAFRMANLTPGKYYVVAQSNRNRMMGMNEKPATPGKPNPQPVRTFYPNALDRAGASALDLHAGQETPGVEIRMRSMETFHIRGKFLGETSQNEGQTMLMLMPQNDDMGSFMSRSMAMVRKDHTFEMSNVMPGAYILTMANNGDKQWAHQMVEVASGDVNDVVVTVQPAVTIHGFVEVQGALSGDAKDKTLESINVSLNPDDPTMMFGFSQAMTKADGTFTLENVMPGKVRVQAFNGPQGAYLQSIRVGNQETLGKTLDLAQAGGGEIHVVFHAGAAQVTGTVTKKPDQSANGSAMVPVSGASILLIPEDLAGNGGLARNASTNQNGTFTANGLTPGVYYALAYELDEYRSLDDPAILKLLVSKGVKVEVKENDKQQVQLTLLPAEELQAALVAAGVEN